MKYIWLTVNIGLVFITNGLWLIVWIPYLLISRKSDVSTKTVSKQDYSKIEKPRKFSGEKFAQDGSKGSVFSYASYSKGFEISRPYAVIDLETTGLNPKKDRIIEIAVRKIDDQGNLIEEISTLINPKVSDIGPTFIHHIKSEDVQDAPTFSEFLPDLINRLNGSIVVAHNAAFEDRFLGAELARLGRRLPKIPCLDTLWLARTTLSLPNYKMGTVLQEFEIDEIDAHTALGDVRMLSKLLPLLLEKSKSIKFSANTLSFGSMDASGRFKTRVSNLKKGEQGWLANLIRKLPETGSEITDSAISNYLEYLEQFLLDGKITGEEAKQLSKLAGSVGLGSAQLYEIHKIYFEKLEQQAQADCVVTLEEKPT